MLDQADDLWPNRGRASDGICASPKHSATSPSSDHEPRVNGYATAVDLTDDKAAGCDADAWAEHLRLTRDPRVKYVICNGRMFSSYATSTRAAWAWVPYTGANGHFQHTHLSVQPNATFDTSPWFPTKDDDDMAYKDWDGASKMLLVDDIASEVIKRLSESGDGATPFTNKASERIKKAAHAAHHLHEHFELKD